MTQASEKIEASATRLQQELVDRITRLIHEDALQPGEKLNENQLARRLAVSRSPVRAALAQLAAGGFLAHRPNRGMVLLARPKAPPAAGAPEDPVKPLLLSIARDRDDGQLGDEISETELMRRYGVTRQEIRNALVLLADMDMIERKPGYGWRFRNRWDEVARRESYEFRIVVEPAAILSPGFALSLGWAAAMRDRHAAVLSAPWTATSSIAFFEMNADFHEGIALASGNRHFHAAIQRQNRLRRLPNYNWQHGFERVRANHAEHMEILDRLEEGEREVAAALMRRHLRIAQAMPYPHPAG